MMKFFINNILILSTLFVFNPTNGFGGCHMQEDKSSDCHRCHEEEKHQKEKGTEQHKESCPMPCCHIALTEIPLLNYKSITLNIIEIDMPMYKQRKTKGYSGQLFRPPIS